MNKKNLAAALAVMAAASFSFNSAKAASQGDILIGFEDKAQNLDYVVDIGAGTKFTSGGAIISSFNAVNLGSDLSTVFGSGWATDANLNWGLIGMVSSGSSANQYTEYASVAAGGAAVGTSSKGAAGPAYSGYYGGLISGLNGDTANGQYLTAGWEQNPSTPQDSGVASWIGNNASASGGPAFQLYNVSLENGIGGNLDIYQANNTNSVELNTLQVTGSGSSASIEAVPEPSTYGLLGLGALVLLIAFRRRTA